VPNAPAPGTSSCKLNLRWRRKISAHLNGEESSFPSYFFADFSRCPPNSNRMAERSLSWKSASPRELNRSYRAVVSTGTGTPSSMAALMVQRPSPESETLPANPVSAGPWPEQSPSDPATRRRSHCRGATPPRRSRDRGHIGSARDRVTASSQRQLHAALCQC
jgi:hypothetical protein